MGDGRDASKTQLGFFKVNLEVLMEHGYHRLRKEQNLMIDHMLLKLYNPVKFSVSHILKQYKKGVTHTLFGHRWGGSRTLGSHLGRCSDRQGLLEELA